MEGHQHLRCQPLESIVSLTPIVFLSVLLDAYPFVIRTAQVLQLFFQDQIHLRLSAFFLLLMRTVTILFPDGRTIMSGSSYSTCTGIYQFLPGDICLVDPPNKQKLKHRGRLCKLTATYNKNSKVRVNFIDDTGGFGYVDIGDLVPNPHSEG